MALTWMIPTSWTSLRLLMMTRTATKTAEKTVQMRVERTGWTKMSKGWEQEFVSESGISEDGQSGVL